MSVSRTAATAGGAADDTRFNDNTAVGSATISSTTTTTTTTTSSNSIDTSNGDNTSCMTPSDPMPLCDPNVTPCDPNVTPCDPNVTPSDPSDLNMTPSDRPTVTAPDTTNCANDSNNISTEGSTTSTTSITTTSSSTTTTSSSSPSSLPSLPSPRPPLQSGEHPGFQFWRERLGAARLVVAPMVDASELAWRMLSRRYGAELCYTPMFHSSLLVKDARYRRDSLRSCAQDRPLIVQLCGNDPLVVAEAARLAAPHCDAVDLNLGCPQAIARRGRYGAYLMDDWDLIERIVRAAVSSSSVPVTCKIRVFSDRQRTLQYARMLQAAGASLLTVHGRTRQQKGPLTGLADWSIVREVREAVDVPVFANGNIQYHADIERCLRATGAQGVMTAEGNLCNPALFDASASHPSGPAYPVWRMALEYLELVEQYPCPVKYARGHLFKLLRHCFSLSENSDIRQTVSRANSVAEMVAAVQLLRDRMEPYASGEKTFVTDSAEVAALPLPPWLCQPYVRVSPEEHVKRCEEGQLRASEERHRASGDTERQSESLSAAGEEQLRASVEQLLAGEDHVQQECSASNTGACASVSSSSRKRRLDEQEVEEKEADLLLRSGHVQHLSKKKAKKLLRNPRLKFPGSTVENLNLCVCRSPRGGKCQYSLCKACCKSKCYRDNLDCIGHKIWVKSKRPMGARAPARITTSTPSSTIISEGAPPLLANEPLPNATCAQDSEAKPVTKTLGSSPRDKFVQRTALGLASNILQNVEQSSVSLQNETNGSDFIPVSAVEPFQGS